MIGENPRGKTCRKRADHRDSKDNQNRGHHSALCCYRVNIAVPDRRDRDQRPPQGITWSRYVSSGSKSFDLEYCCAHDQDHQNGCYADKNGTTTRNNSTKCVLKNLRLFDVK